MAPLIVALLAVSEATTPSIIDLASRLFTSRSRMCKIFKDNTGFTINNYLTMYRLQVACVLLQQGQKVNVVYKIVGFKSYAHFIRTFTAKLGKSPTRFAKEQERNDEGIATEKTT